jgi:D-alanyl-D-alanine endopeptidase (penicillin-binding protein 7)
MSSKSMLLWALGCAWVLGATQSLAQQQPKQDLALASVSAVAADLHSREILVAKHSDTVLPIASVTKLMTAMVILDSGAPMDAWLAIEPWNSNIGKNAYSRIRLDSQARRKDLLRIALMSSENRAAYNLAAHHPGGFDQFVAAMNAKAQELGMVNTHFVDPTGLSPANRSSARDLVQMVAQAYDYAFIREYSTTRQYSPQFRAPRYRLGYGNTNPLTGSSRWNVSLQKTGYLNEAGRCLVMVTHINGKDVAMVLLNSFGTRSPVGDAGRIRRWLETGTESTVAGAARDYEQQMRKTYGLE